MFSLDRHGAKAAELALRVLHGENAADIEASAEGANVTMLDWGELQRWGIDEHNVPGGAVVQNRVASTWGPYKWHIVSAVSLFVAEGALIFALLAQRARRRRVEAALGESRHRIDDLAGRLIIAQEEERNHIARELHDDLNQQVAALAIGISRLKNNLPNGESVCPRSDREPAAGYRAAVGAHPADVAPPALHGAAPHRPRRRSGGLLPRVGRAGQRHRDVQA